MESILFLFTYAKIEYVSICTYPSKIEYVRYVSSSPGVIRETGIPSIFLNSL